MTLFGLNRNSFVLFPFANAPTRTSIVFLARAAVVVLVAVERENGIEEVLIIFAALVMVIGEADLVTVTVMTWVGPSVHNKLGTL